MTTKKYAPYEEPDFMKPKNVPVQDMPVSDKDKPTPDKEKVVAKFPSLSVGDIVTISDEGYTVNGKFLKAVAVENTMTTNIIANSITLDVPTDIVPPLYEAEPTMKVTFSYQAAKYFAYEEDIVSNPLKSMDYMRIDYSGRFAVIEQVPVIFVSRVISESPIKLVTNAFIRDKNNKIVNPTATILLSNEFTAHNPGTLNELAYVFYGSAEHADRIKLSSAEVSNEKVEDTYMPDETKNDAFMREKLIGWGYPASQVNALSGQTLTDLYMSEQQRRAPKPPPPSPSADPSKNASIIAANGPKNQITPNPNRDIPRPPIIKHTPLPDTGFRKYAAKILIITFIAGGIVMYRRLKKEDALNDL
jgi:hypothetical protein